MRILIDTSRVQLSPTEQLTLHNIRSRMRQQARPLELPAPGVMAAVDEVLGKPERKQ
jgi:hypothetical protein